MKAEEDVTQRGRYDWWRRAIVMGRSCLTRHIVYKNGTFYGRLHRNGKGAESLYMHTLYELRKAILFWIWDGLEKWLIRGSIDKTYRTQDEVHVNKVCVNVNLDFIFCSM